MMRYRLVGGILLGCLSAVLHAQAPGITSEPQVTELSALEEVVVTGSRTGPRLWKVSKADHVLWLLGTPGALPKDVIWQSQDVEAVISESQRVLAGMNVKATPGLFSMLPLYLQYRRMVKLPDHQTLKDWLSPEAYQRFVILKSRYAAEEQDLDEYRPTYAAQQLWRAARKAAGLNERINVQAEVLKLARKHNVRIDKETLKLEQPGAAIATTLKELAQMPREKDIACLEATMARLETDVGEQKARANAWALGDVDSLRRLQTTERSVCWDALASSSRLKQLEQQIQDYWMSAALKALAVNQSTFGMRPIEELIGETGVLTRFRSAGYLVAGP